MEKNTDWKESVADKPYQRVSLKEKLEAMKVKVIKEEIDKPAIQKDKGAIL